LSGLLASHVPDPGYDLPSAANQSLRRPAADLSPLLLSASWRTPDLVDDDQVVTLDGFDEPADAVVG